MSSLLFDEGDDDTPSKPGSLPKRYFGLLLVYCLFCSSAAAAAAGMQTERYFLAQRTAAVTVSS